MYVAYLTCGDPADDIFFRTILELKALTDSQAIKEVRKTAKDRLPIKSICSVYLLDGTNYIAYGANGCVRGRRLPPAD